MKIRNFLTLFILPFLLAAQVEELDLSLSRDWGYGGFDNSIQGRFSMHASGPEGLVEVRFRIDGDVVNIDTEAPYSFQFETDSYPPGTHELSATGLLTDGREIQSVGIVRNFLSAEDANDQTKGLVIPLLVVVGGITLLGVGMPLLFGRKKKHTPGVYGAAGGAVCRRCQMPFSRTIFAPNMVVGKLERCPHCGKWSIVPRASAAALAEAEARLAGEGRVDGQPFESAAQKKERLMDESRFDN